MTDQSEWTGNVGNVWAREWQRTDRSFVSLTARLLEVARASPFSQALDIGCGAGEISLKLARGAPAARVTGVDVSSDLLETARERGKDQSNLHFEQCDAARWAPADGQRPDLIVSRHGVMFFADPVAAFAHVAGQAVGSARLVFSCFRERAENDWVRSLASVVPSGDAPVPDPDAPGPFAFGRRDRVEGILSRAGWRDIGFEAIDYGMVAGDGENAVDDALSYFLRIGPAARAVAALEDDRRDEVLDRLRTMLHGKLVDGRVTLPAACWIVTARAPG